MDTTAQLNVATTAVAIAECVYCNHEGYKALYDRIAGPLGGFPGIWDLIAQCAIALETHPFVTRGNFWASVNLPDVSEAIAEAIFKLDAAPSNVDTFISEIISPLYMAEKLSA
jgi:hypothetical protein